jgi:chaperonin GroES
LGDRVIIKPDPDEKKTKGGVFLPETARPEERGGVVVAVGPGRITETGFVVEPRVRVGDRILRYKVGSEIQYDGETHIILKESDLIAIERP